VSRDTAYQLTVAYVVLGVKPHTEAPLPSYSLHQGLIVLDFVQPLGEVGEWSYLFEGAFRPQAVLICSPLKAKLL